jgi:xanthine dehydrogenase YagR molybdenum-binding subunit
LQQSRDARPGETKRQAPQQGKGHEGAFAAGRLMNTRTVRSQLMGGMIWGISSALHEVTEIDKGRARYVNDNLADYLVPVNADIE